MATQGGMKTGQVAEQLAEALVLRAEAQYERRFVEGEQVDGKLRDELSEVRRELGELVGEGREAAPSVRRRSAYAAGLVALMLEGAASECAKSALQTAVKLDPWRVGAWNALGHCYWAEGDLRLARNCFERGLDAEDGNKESLRQLSVLRRHTLSSAAAQQSGCDEAAEAVAAAASSASVKEAKAAVQHDPTDGYSWYVLGTAHLMAGLRGRLDGPSMRQALAAYQQAEKLGSRVPELFYNRGILQQTMQRYAEAILDFRKAEALDLQLPCGQQVARLKALMSALQRGVKAVEMLPPRKLAAAARALGMASTKAGDLACESVTGLVMGCNKGVSIHCRVMRRVKAAEPAHVIALDTCKNVFALVVSGVREGQLLEGSNMLVQEPEMAAIEIGEGGRVPGLRLLRVFGLNKVLVNGDVLSPAALSPLQVSAIYSPS